MTAKFGPVYKTCIFSDYLWQIVEKDIRGPKRGELDIEVVHISGIIQAQESC